MRQRFRRCAYLLMAAACLLLLRSPVAGAAEQQDSTGRATTSSESRDAVARSLPYLASAGQAWIDDKKCVSCHRVSFLTWTHNAAKAKGFEVDDTRLREWLDWSIEKSLTPSAEGKPVDGELNVDGLSQLLLGHRKASPAELDDESLATFTTLILKTQQADGSWQPAGQLPMQKRPAVETTQVSTMWNLLALQAVPASDEIAAGRAKGETFLESPLDATSTEWHAARLLLAHADGDAAIRDEEIAALRATQHKDGGWGWLTADESDALGTGQALYALVNSGVSRDETVVQRAQEFLTRTQGDDGSWPVRGTKEKKKTSNQETATYWGTAWATLALLEALE